MLDKKSTIKGPNYFIPHYKGEKTWTVNFNRYTTSISRSSLRFSIRNLRGPPSCTILESEERICDTPSLHRARGSTRYAIWAFVKRHSSYETRLLKGSRAWRPRSGRWSKKCARLYKFRSRPLRRLRRSPRLSEKRLCHGMRTIFYDVECL
jgi:hypothetical protein